MEAFPRAGRARTQTVAGGGNSASRHHRARLCGPETLRARLQALGITHAHYAVQDKRVAAQATLSALGLQWGQAAVMGDDWPDLALMDRCAFSAAPPNAHAEVLAAADYVSARRGGDGAAREFCDLLLVAGGKYAGLLAEARS